MRQQIQKFGRALSGMVMPNIGAFIAWGFVTALFIPSGWWPNTQMARLVDPMLTYLLPLLIAYTAGRNVAGERGGVIGAIAAMGVIVGSDIPMFIGAMVMGPLGGYTIRWFDKLTQGRIKAGFEMLVSNFSIGILGMLLAILGYWVIGGAVTGLTLLVSNGVEVVIRHGLLPLVSLLVEPSKVLFLNNALNHGIFSPIGIEQARETGQSIMFLLETNPGPGLGVLLACWFFGRGNMRQSAPGAVIIQFCGGIHEIYFPYILARPTCCWASAPRCITTTPRTCRAWKCAVWSKKRVSRPPWPASPPFPTPTRCCRSPHRPTTKWNVSSPKSPKHNEKTEPPSPAPGRMLRRRAARVRPGPDTARRADRVDRRTASLFHL